MRNWLTRTPLLARMAVALLLVTGITVALSTPVAQAADATQVVMTGVDTTMTADRDSDEFTVELRDGGDATDTGYTGTVTFSAIADCGDCFDVSLTDGGAALAGEQYTFLDTDDGVQTFFIKWKAAAISEPHDLHVSATLTVGGPATALAADVNITSNAATKIELENVDTAPTVGALDDITVIMRNANDQMGADFTGTVEFSASCIDCFAIAPNDGGASDEEYTFVEADDGTKQLTLIWKPAALSPPSRTFTAGTSGIVPAASVPGITVGAPVTPPTTPTTAGATTTSTTIPPHIAEPMLITGAGPGGGPHVIARAADNKAVLLSFYAYGANFTGGVRVATGDVNNDGHDDIITAPGPGGGPHVRVFSGKTGVVLNEFMAYAANFTGGVFVAAADVNNDGKADIITGPDQGGGPHVKIFNGASSLNGTDGNLLGQFMAYTPTFGGGVRVAGGDFDDDGKADILTGAGPGGGPHVRLLHADGTEVAALPDGGFYAYGAAFTGGVYVAADPSNFGVIYTGAGAGGGRHVRLFQPAGNEVLGFIASGANQGAIPAVGDTQSAASEVFLLSRATGNATVQRLNDSTGAEVDSFAAYAAGVGVFVAVGVL